MTINDMRLKTATNICQRCGDNKRIATRTDDGTEELCVFCMVKRSKELQKVKT